MMRVLFLAAVLTGAAVFAEEPSFHTLHMHHMTPAKTNSTMPAEGSVWPVGIYYVPVSVGTPPQVFPVAIDSGSSSLDIQGKCSECPSTAPNNQYSPTDSKTSKSVFPYRFSNTYETCDLSDMTAPCTITGDVYEDDVTLGGLGPVPVQFGAISTLTSNFNQFQRICGVMGFASSSKQTVFAQLVANGAVKEDIWALCIHHGSKSNGTLTLGGVDDRLHTGAVQYVSDVGASQGFYGVGVSGGITVEGVSTPLAGSQSDAILDTGTNILLLPDTIFQSLSQTLKTLCASKTLPGVCGSLVTDGKSLLEGKCFRLSSTDIQSFPPISFNLDNGVVLTLNPQDYLVAGDVRAAAQGDASLICLAVRNTGREGLYIIGDTLMRNYYLVFDRASTRIGWAPVNTDNCGSVE